MLDVRSIQYVYCFFLFFFVFFYRILIVTIPAASALRQLLRDHRSTENKKKKKIRFRMDVRRVKKPIVNDPLHASYVTQIPSIIDTFVLCFSEFFFCHDTWPSQQGFCFGKQSNVIADIYAFIYVCSTSSHSDYRVLVL